MVAGVRPAPRPGPGAVVEEPPRVGAPAVVARLLAQGALDVEGRRELVRLRARVREVAVEVEVLGVAHRLRRAQAQHLGGRLQQLHRVERQRRRLGPGTFSGLGDDGLGPAAPRERGRDGAVEAPFPVPGHVDGLAGERRLGRELPEGLGRERRDLVLALDYKAERRRLARAVA